MLYILSKHETIFFKPEKESYLVRISDVNEPLSKLNFQVEEELHLGFHDVSLQILETHYLPDNWIIFNPKMAQQVLELFEKCQNDNADLIVHCYAGFSRSSAIALSYAWFTNDKDLEKEILNSHYTPNTLILHEMNRLMGTNKESIIEQYKKIK